MVASLVVGDKEGIMVFHAGRGNPRCGLGRSHHTIMSSGFPTQPVLKLVMLAEVL